MLITESETLIPLLPRYIFLFRASSRVKSDESPVVIAVERPAGEVVKHRAWSGDSRGARPLIAAAIFRPSVHFPGATSRARINRANAYTAAGAAAIRGINAPGTRPGNYAARLHSRKRF